MTPAGANLTHRLDTGAETGEVYPRAPAAILAFPLTVAETMAAPGSSAHAASDPMVRPIRTWDGAVVGQTRLPPEVFGHTPRADILQRVVVWQESRRHKGQHKTQSRNEVSRTGKKMYKQKGTGGARHGSRRAAQFVGGAKAHGPVLRDQTIDLPKKVRKLGLAHALSDRARDGALEVVESAVLETYKTQHLAAKLEALGVSDALIVISGEEHLREPNLRLASRNLPRIDLLPVEGVNVLSILKRHTLIVTTEALQKLGDRCLPPPDEPSAAALARAPDPAWGAADAAKVLSAVQALANTLVRDRYPDQLSHMSVVVSDSRSGPGGAKLVDRPAVLSNMELRAHLRTLRLGAAADRIEAMKALRLASLQGVVTDEAVRRLLPLLVSDDKKEALEAAETLCELRFPGSRSARAELLSEIMHEEGVEFVTYVDHVKASSQAGHVRLRARLSRTLPLTISGESVRLDVPAWIETASEFRCRVSGVGVKLESIEQHDTTGEAGDMHAIELVFDVVKSGDQEFAVDFFADDRWLDRQTLTVKA